MPEYMPGYCDVFVDRSAEPDPEFFDDPIASYAAPTDDAAMARALEWCGALEWPSVSPRSAIRRGLIELQPCALLELGERLSFVHRLDGKGG